VTEGKIMAEKTKKEDRRIRYTKQVIKDTLLQLLEKNHFAKITVTELCRRAEINRGTFYLHYYEGCTAPQISRILGKNVHTIYTLLTRSKQMLREKLGDGYDYE
jgi:DNA-directed RNA polymerase specialized sigma24 family protein